MILKKITLYNFRQYYGKKEIEFSTEKDKNVTVIIGDNGAGKTTLLQAFVYCLYGSEYIVFSRKNELLNFKAAKENKGNADVYVQLEFLHGKKQYRIRRTREHYQSNNKRGYKFKQDVFNGFVSDEKGANKVVEEQVIAIIPPTLKELFFFDGERMEMLAETKSKKILSDAVVNMLGLNTFEETMNILIGNGKYCVENLFRRQIIPRTADADKIIKDIEKYNQRLINIDNDIKTLKDELFILEKKEEILSQQIRSFQPTKDNQKRREYLEQLIKKNEMENERNEKYICNYFADVGPDLLINNLTSEVFEVINNSNLKDKGLVGITSDAINELIKRGECLCGAKIVSGNNVYKKLLEWKLYLPPQNMSSLLVNIKNNIDLGKQNVNKIEQNIKNLYKLILRNRNEIKKHENEIQSISQIIIKYDNIEDVEKEYQNVKICIKKISSKIGALEYERDKELYPKIDHLKKLEKDMLKQDEENKVIEKKLHIMNKVFSLIKKNFDNKVVEARNKLQVNASEIYENLLNEQYNIILNDDYSFDICDSKYEDITEVISEGEKIVSSFAFVGALIRSTIELNKMTDESEDYPLVMDAPFAKLDNKHRGNVGKHIPKLASQIIIFSIDSQWEGAVEDNMHNRVGRRYVITKDDREHVTTIRNEENNEI